MSFTEKIDVLELLHNVIVDHEQQAISLVNQIENMAYLMSPHERVTPGNSPVIYTDHSQGSRRGGRRL